MAQIKEELELRSRLHSISEWITQTVSTSVIVENFAGIKRRAVVIRLSIELSAGVIRTDFVLF
jgi:hypothetical protein